MVNGFKVITLCGSTRFKEEFLEAQKRLTLEGNIVISVGLFGHSGDDEVWTKGVKDMLDRQHLAKIDLADEIFVINVGGYIGDSTKREIAYAEFKGKKIKYMENSKKASIYDNYAALQELHDLGRISNEDFEQAGRDFDEKRKAAIDEYNACKGPWPYQWDNADVVVCGILQRFGFVSCDFYDLKYLYEADSISEIRIKGKGTNKEEQVQSIIDTIRNDYMDLLQSSEKLAVTIIDSNRGAFLNKIADCLIDMDVIWHEWAATAEEKEISLSIVTATETNLQYKLREWSKWTLESYLSEVNHVGENVATSFYNQSDLSRVKDCELMIIGINPGAGCLFSQWGLKDQVLSNSDFLYRGNPCFQGLSDKEIIYEMSQKYDKDKKRYGWDLWKKIHKMLGYAGKGELLEKLDRFVLTNMIFFGTDKENQIPKGVNKEKCAEQTIELISILQPKVVLLLGNQSRKLFDRVSENKLEVLVPNSMYHCMSGKCHVLAIKHTAYYYSSIEMELIGKTIGYVLDHSEEIINKECIYSSYIKEDIICFEESQMANQPKRKAKMDSTRIIELIITSPYFQLTQIEKENYSLSKNLMIRITKTGNGYLAIRHKNYDVQYPNSKYDFTERYRNVLKEKGWNCDTPFWLGTKLIKDYGRKDDEIVTKIVSEINDIVELVNKVY